MQKKTSQNAKPIPLKRVFDNQVFNYSGSYAKKSEAEKTKKNLKIHGIRVRIVKTNGGLWRNDQLIDSTGRPLGYPEPGQYFYALYHSGYNSGRR